MCINLFTFWDDEGMARTPVYISSKPYANTIDLLYWETGEKDGTNSDGHYAWIKTSQPSWPTSKRQGEQTSLV